MTSQFCKVRVGDKCIRYHDTNFDIRGMYNKYRPLPPKKKPHKPKGGSGNGGSFPMSRRMLTDVGLDAATAFLIGSGYTYANYKNTSKMFEAEETSEAGELEMSAFDENLLEDDASSTLTERKFEWDVDDVDLFAEGEGAIPQEGAIPYAEPEISAIPCGL